MITNGTTFNKKRFFGGVFQHAGLLDNDGTIACSKETMDGEWRKNPGYNGKWRRGDNGSSPSSLGTRNRVNDSLHV